MKYRARFFFGSQSAKQTEKPILINKLFVPVFVDSFFFTHMYARLISTGTIVV